MILLTVTLLHALWHPLSSAGASLYGGVGGDLGELGIIGAIIAGYRHKNCHVKGCWHLGHIDPVHGHPACRKHHSMSDMLGG